MPWVVTMEDHVLVRDPRRPELVQTRSVSYTFDRDDWSGANEQFEELVWDWAEAEDDFEAATNPDQDGYGWADTLEDDGFGDDAEIGKPRHMSLGTGGPHGRVAGFRLQWVEDPDA